MMAGLHVNDAVKTPNGPGVVQGMLKNDDELLVMVRHKAIEMTGTTAGTAWSHGKATAPMYLYTPEELMA